MSAQYIAQRSAAGWTVVSTGSGAVIKQFAPGSHGAEEAAAAAATLNRQHAVRDSLSSAALTPAALKIWRRKQHITQGKLAQQLGVHISTVHRWEGGDVPIPVWLRLALEGLDQRKELTQP